MLAPANGLLRAGIGLKLSQIKLATRSYLRDRTKQATGTVTSYAIAAGLFAAAGIFLIAACIVGTMALFRWIEIHYGQFWAFGAIGALLVAIAAICAGLAAARLNAHLRTSPPSPAGFASRSRPIRSNRTRSRPREIPRPRSCGSSAPPSASSRAAIPTGREQQEGAGRPDHDGELLGWAAARRRWQARQRRLMPARIRPREICS